MKTRLRLMRSLRVRLLIGTCLASGIILGMLGFGIYLSIRRSLISDFDKITLAKAQTLAVTAEQNGDAVQFEFDPQQMPEFSSGPRSEYFEAWKSDGTVLLRSESLGSQTLGDPSMDSKPRLFDGVLPNGRAGRFLTLQFLPRNEHQADSAPTMPVWVRVARETRTLDQNLSRLAWLLTGLCAAAIVLMAAVLFWVVHRGLLPARRLAKRIQTFKETNLADRFVLDDVPPELAPIVSHLNGLLDRLEKAFGHERAFTADVAHELRTPLAGLRTTLQVCRSKPRQQAAYESTIETCLKISDQMQEMVENLLLLARADAGALAASCSEFDVRALLEECWLTFAPRAEDQKLSVEFELAENCGIETDREKLRIVFCNLLDNAVSYVDSAGTISIRVARNGNILRVEISNSGSQISREDLPALTGRFWRGDASRSEIGHHCGLGLSLCHRLTMLLNGQLRLQSEAGGKFVATVELPAKSFSGAQLSSRGLEISHRLPAAR